MRNTKTKPGTRGTGRNRLRGEIVGGALVVTLTLLLLFAGYAGLQARRVRTATALDTLTAVAAVQEARIGSIVERGEADFQLVASRDRLRRNLDAHNRAPAPQQLDELSDILTRSQEAAHEIEFIEIYDRDLDHVVGTSPFDFEFPPSRLAQAKDGMVSGLVVDTGLGNQVHLIAGPLFSSGGRLIGVAVVAQSADSLLDVVGDRSGLGRTGEVMVAQAADDDPRYIAPLKFRPQATLQPVDQGVGGFPMGRALAGVETEITDTIDYRGVDVLAVTRHVDGPDWGLVAKIDRAEALSPVQDFALVSAAVLAASLVLAYFLAKRTAENILRPVRRMTNTAKAIASGRRDLRVGSRRDDELGELAEAFDQMTLQLDTLATQLEGRVEERTRELQEKNAQLARLMEEKETFLAGVSHEVRSPLTAMIGFIELVNDAGEALGVEERSEMLETVSRQADDVLNMIEDLLASARAEAGTLKVAAVEVDLAAQARQVIESLGRNTRLHIDIGGAALALADPARVRQIIRNLVTNADRYGGSNVEIVVRGAGGDVAIEVRDDGEGVDDADRSTIFEAYGQSDGARSVHESVGLGLHVSRNLARLMGGDLTYRFEDGWSVFELSLPAYEETSPAAPDGGVATSATSTPVAAG